eukprot:2048683-Rhodomonas_salina.1
MFIYIPHVAHEPKNYASSGRRFGSRLYNRSTSHCSASRTMSSARSTSRRHLRIERADSPGTNFPKSVHTGILRLQMNFAATR